MDISSDFLINPTPALDEIDFVLGEVWGKESPIGKIHRSETSETKAISILHSGRTIGCASINIFPWKEVEYGSLAILSDYRGKGLSSLINRWIDETVKPYLKNGYKLTAYATVGSKVLYSIIKTMENCTGSDCLPLNLAPGVVPVDLEKSKINIDKSVLIPSQDGFNLNSTIQVSSMNDIIYGDVKVFPNIKKYLDGHELKAGRIIHRENKLTVLPILMDIYQVRQTDNLLLEKTLKEYSKNKILRIDVPMIFDYQQTINSLINKKLFFTGISVVDDTVYLSFLNKVPKEIVQILNYLTSFPDKKISRFGKMILVANKGYLLST